MSNNKQIMKLYTEEQVLKMLEVYRDTDLYEHILTFEDILKTQTPIKLISDEEIDKEINNEYPLTGHVGIDHRNYLRKVGYIQGAKWMRDKIQGGNNEQQ